MCFQVQRLAEYERYLGHEARSLQVENGDSGSVGSGAVLQRGQLEGDLHRIQELFPGDNLRLHERDVLTTVCTYIYIYIYIRIPPIMTVINFFHLFTLHLSNLV